MASAADDLKFEKDATTPKAIFEEAQERLKIAVEHESENRLRGIAARKFRNGEQWDADIKNDRKIDQRPALTINRTNTFVQRQKNTLRQQRPRIKCQPCGGGARVEDAEVINGMLRHIQVLSNADVAFDNGVECAIDIGWGYWRVVTDFVDHKSFDQELLIKMIRNPFSVYMDPNAVMPAGEDQQWCFITEKMKRREYRLKYLDAANTEWQGDGPGDISLAWESKEEILLAEYYRIHQRGDVLYMMSDGRTALKSELPSEESRLASGWTIVLDPTGHPMQRKTIVPEVQWFRLNGSQVVDERSSAAARRSGDPAKGPIPGRFVPVIRCEGDVLDINGIVSRKGMVEDMMDPARMFNYWRTAQTERYALAPKAPWVVAEGQTDGHPEWDDANRRSYSRLVYKPVTGPDGITVLAPPMRQEPAPVEVGMTEAAMGAERDLMAIAGEPTDDPEIRARIVSGNKHLQRRQGMQDLTHFQYYDKQKLAMTWTGVVLLEQMPYVYDTKRMQRIIGDDGKAEMVMLNDPEGGESAAIYRVKNNLEIGRFDIVMDTGPGYATKREEGAENMVNLLTTPLAEPIVKAGADLVVRNMDFAGADELADRLAPATPEGMESVLKGLPKQAQTIVTSLQATIQQQQQVIQQQALEIKYKSSIEAAKIEGANNREELKDRTKRFEIETDATTRRDVAEIGAAAQLLNSQMESASEERQADKMIQKGLDA